MNDIYSLLNINSDVIHDYPLLANRVVDHQIEKVINSNIGKLKLIEDCMLIDKGIEIPKRSIDEVICKVIRLSKQNDSSFENWTIRELRIVSYYLMKLRNNSTDYYFALNLLDNNWRNIYFNGLIFYLMNAWNSIEAEYRDATSKLVTKKLRGYTGNNKRYKHLKNHTDLFEKAGPIRMAAIISAKKMKLIDAPIILGFKKSIFKQSYFSDVIIKYIESNNINDLNYIEEILEFHDLDRTKKLLFANLVEKADKIGDGLNRSILCRYINRILGDVTLVSTWAPFAGATYAEAEKLKRTMKLVNMWFAQQIIEVFFEVCVQDRDRKNFWLKYVQYVSGFKIVGSTAIKCLLQNNSKIGGMFLKHFIETNQYSSQTAALVLFIKNKMIVEFSDTGALYVYNQNHNQVKLITSRQRGLNSTNDLKIPSMQMLIEISEWGFLYLNEEGRMHHRGHWQSRLSSWLQKIVLSSDNTNISFLDLKDDDIFKETPLPNEEDVSLEDNFEELNKAEEINRQEGPNFDIIIYENNVKIKIYSKWVDNVRVVANDKGFYVNKVSSSQFAKIKKMLPGQRPIGSIWIKRTNNPEWSEIVHFYNGAEICIGYMKQVPSGILYKETIIQQNSKIIDFK